jgi:signal transduction histidine kinase
MGTEGESRKRIGHRRLAFAVVVSLAVVLVGAGITFANSISASKVASNAAALHWANAASGTSALTRAALAQALTFSVLRDQGIAEPADLEFAIENAASALSELAELEANGTNSSSLGALSGFRVSAERTLLLLEESDVPSASGEFGVLEGHYTRLLDSLRQEQDAIQSAIAANTEMGQRVNGLIMFAMTLVIPAAAVTAYWWIARRQIIWHKEQARLALESERQLGRAKDQFIAGLSHELRTPLTSIYGFAEILAEGEAASNPQELGGIIANEASELARMVDDLLTASRLSSTGVEVEIVPTRIARVVESAIAPFQRAGVEVERDLNGAIALADPARLRHILVNLLSNAARHGGDKIGVEVAPSTGTVDIEVWDNGPGVPEERVDRLFTSYANDGQSPILTGSIGLGLAVAASLAGKMDGGISYQRYGGRSYFTVTIPGCEPDPQSEPHESVAEVIRGLS